MQLPPLATMRARANIVAQIRAFFAARNFIEVDTPVAVRAPAPESAIDPVPTRFAAKLGRRSVRWLQTSPELAMKRLVAHGLGNIYQLAPVFRDGDFSPLHRPEFRLLEWYRPAGDTDALMRDCEALIASLLPYARSAKTTAAGERARLDACTPPYPRICVHDAFLRHAQIDLRQCAHTAGLAAALRAKNVHHLGNDSWADLFHRVFVALVEPALLRRHGAFFLTDFPAPLASLAQLKPRDPAVADRFELYLAGAELANGFQELRCAKEQRHRFNQERRLRRQNGKRCAPLDEAYLQALCALPVTAGIALGIERLLLALLGGSDIDAISFVPWSLA